MHAEVHVWWSEDNLGDPSLVSSCVEPGSLFLFPLLHCVYSMLAITPNVEPLFLTPIGVWDHRFSSLHLTLVCEFQH